MVLESPWKVLEFDFDKWARTLSKGLLSVFRVFFVCFTYLGSVCLFCVFLVYFSHLCWVVNTVQEIAWKDLSPKWHIMCLAGRKTTHSFSTLFLLLLDYYVIRPILFYYIFDCPNPASGLQYRNKRIKRIVSYQSTEYWCKWVKYCCMLVPGTWRTERRSKADVFIWYREWAGRLQLDECCAGSRRCETTTLREQCAQVTTSHCWLCCCVVVTGVLVAVLMVKLVKKHISRLPWKLS